MIFKCFIKLFQLKSKKVNPKELDYSCYIHGPK